MHFSLGPERVLVSALVVFDSHSFLWIALIIMCYPVGALVMLSLKEHMLTKFKNMLLVNWYLTKLDLPTFPETEQNETKQMTFETYNLKKNHFSNIIQTELK